MENCYALLGISPMAGTEEIEEAYGRKKKEFGADAAKQKELDDAYNEAIMATFAPIRAFSSPLPPLTIGKHKKMQPQAPIQPDYVPNVLQPTTSQSAYAAPSTGVSADQEVADLVEEATVSFTDAELMNMNVSELRGNYFPLMKDDDEDETGFLTLGIENKLLRYYAWTYIVMVTLDIVMRLWIGPRWLALTEFTIPERAPALLSILFAFLSIVYCFVCALPMPFATRFFLLGQPPDKSSMLWGLFFLSIVCAFFLRWLTGRFLPPGVAGSMGSFVVIAMALSLGTLRYSGD